MYFESFGVSLKVQDCDDLMFAKGVKQWWIAMESVFGQRLSQTAIIFMTILLAALFAPACESQNRYLLGHSEINAPTFAIRITEFEEKRFPLSRPSIPV